MEKPKPTQNSEQEPKTLEDYVVATFHADADPDMGTPFRFLTAASSTLFDGT